MCRSTKLLLVGISLLFAGCANFRELGEDLEFIDNTSVIGAQITNASEYENVVGFVVRWDKSEKKVLSADYAPVGQLGGFAFFVDNPDKQYLLAFSDQSGNQRYDAGVDPAWIHSDSSGNPIPVAIDYETNLARFQGELSSHTILPEALVETAREFAGQKSREEIATGWSIPIELGKIADLDSPIFTASHGDEGLWQPASFSMESGIGVYFIEAFDPEKIPVLFVYGATGTPKNFNLYFENLDQSRFQPWFFFYPSGSRLDRMANLLNHCVELLHDHYKFDRMDVVAHSMGGLVARSFILKSLEAGHRYINRFVSLSTPWDGLSSVSAGVKLAPQVVPSWYDLEPGSAFQQQLFEMKLSPKVSHLLIYSHKASKALTLPKENDGTVSVASQTTPQATEDATKVLGFEEDHVSILYSKDVLQTVETFLIAPTP